ncbi:MAG: 4-(cytidine 5'-diphospho)-2-C-methyl-D-erythritol kinase [Elusimicrobia bacterium]|nr:4-(cytidine 5'-diphospho)-2-C-methyl-D-erythritol kinase [Elusimicrobiota bacterium]
MRSLKINAPAKINLFLEVTGKRRDGYHNLATLFAKISLFDSLALKKVRRTDISLKVINKANLALSRAEDNIVYKAARKFFEAFPVKPAVEIELVKRIPVGAGLGGGSSDAAAVLKALSLLYGLNIGRNFKKLHDLAAGLGSDAPFFLSDAAFAAGTGRGEILKPVRFSGRPPFIVLVYPGTPVYTGPVYRALRPVPSGEKAANLKKFKTLIKALESGSPPGIWGELLFNRLEEPVLSSFAPALSPGASKGRGPAKLLLSEADLPAYKAVREAKADLIKAGAAAVLMSGSGASVFALAPGRAAASRISKSVKKPGRKIFLLNFLLKF